MSEPIDTDTEVVTFDRDLLLVGWLGFFLVALDQGTKWVAELLPSWPIVDAARSGGELFSGANPDTLWATPIALIASAALMLLAVGLYHAQHLTWWAVAVVGAGTVGTVIDLVAFGSMRTWFMVGPTRWSVALVCVLAAAPSLVRATVAALRSAAHEPISDRVDGSPIVAPSVIRIPPLSERG